MKLKYILVIFYLGALALVLVTYFTISNKKTFKVAIIDVDI